LPANSRIIEAEKAVQAASAETLQNQISAMSGFGDAMSSVLSEIGKDNEKFAAFQKMLALFNIAINTGAAIAAATATAAQGGDPYTVALRIAAAVAGAIAGMVAALSQTNKAKQPKAPKFAGGGAVQGAGSGTSDSIPAFLSNGESVMTAAATSMFAPLISPLNVMGGGVPIQATEVANQVMGEDMIARAMIKGFAAMPPSFVGVDEIQRVTNRVVGVLENNN